MYPMFGCLLGQGALAQHGEIKHNSGGFSGIFKVGVGVNFLKFAAGKDPFPSHVHARRGRVAGV
jgi:hypothetical protein